MTTLAGGGQGGAPRRLGTSASVDLAGAWAVAGALALTCLRLMPWENQYVTLLARAYQGGTSLADDLVVRAALAVPYTLAPRILARSCAFLEASLGLHPDIVVGGLQALLWTIQACLMYRVTRALTGSREAGVLATLFFGADMPMSFADSPYCMQFLERSLGMVPLLWSLERLAAGRPWGALGGLGIATYCHANPAIYLWPWMIYETILKPMVEDSRAKPGALLRLVLAGALAWPLLRGAGLSPFPQDPAYVSLTLISHSPWIAGKGLSLADTVFALEGIAMLGLAYLRLRRFGSHAALRPLARAAVACVALLAFGTLSHSGFQAGWPGTVFWGVGVKLQPWIGLFVLDWSWLIVLAAWFAREWAWPFRGDPSDLGGRVRSRTGDSWAWAVWMGLVMILSISRERDFILRGFGLAALGALILRRPRIAGAALLAAAALPFAYALAPELLHSMAGAAGLRGGIFSLPVFRPVIGCAMLACMALGWLAASEGMVSVVSPDAWLPRPWMGRFLAAACAILLAAGIARRWARRPSVGPGGVTTAATAGMADWIRENTPPGAVIQTVPLGLLPDAFAFKARSRRSLYAYAFYVHGAMMFGEAAAGMLERLRALNFNPDRIRRVPDIFAEFDEAARAMTPSTLERLSGPGRPTHLLAPANARWPGQPVHQAGGLALYRL